MKKIILLGVTGFCLMLCGTSGADTIGSPADINLPAGKGVYSAQMGDFISLNAGFDVELLDEKEFEHDSAVSRRPTLEGVFYMAKLGCTLFNRIQPYIKAGMSELEMSWNDANGTVKVETSTEPSWGAGIKVHLLHFEKPGIKVFTAASFRSTKADKIRTVSVAGATGNITEKKFEIFERQAALGVSKEFSLADFGGMSLVPYLGGAWSETNARVRVTQRGNIINSGANGQVDNLGFFFGSDFVLTDNLSLNVEGRLIDQQSASLGFTALF